MSYRSRNAIFSKGYRYIKEGTFIRKTFTDLQINVHWKKSNTFIRNGVYEILGFSLNPLQEFYKDNVKRWGEEFFRKIYVSLYNHDVRIKVSSSSFLLFTQGFMVTGSRTTFLYPYNKSIKYVLSTLDKFREETFISPIFRKSLNCWVPSLTNPCALRSLVRNESMDHYFEVDYFIESIFTTIS